MARKVYTGKPGSCGGSFTLDADVEALTVYAASITLPSPVEGTGASRSDTHTITVDVFGGAQMAYLGSVDLVSKVHTLPADTVTGSDYSGTWVATSVYPTARRILVRGTHSNSSAAALPDGFVFDALPSWGPRSKPNGTVISEVGVADLGSGSPAELEYQAVVNSQDFWTSLENNKLPSISLQARRKAGSGFPPTVNLAVDVLDDRGNWIETQTSVSSAWWRGYDAPTWGDNMAALATHQTVSGGLYTGKFPGSVVAWNITKVGVRLSTDPVGTNRYGTVKILFLDVPGVDAPSDIPFAVKVGFDVSMDTYTPGTTSVTGDTPAITDGTHTVVAQPDPSTGGIKVTDGAGNTVGTTGPLPGGPVNGPITLRIDGDTLMVIYAGDVVWVYKLADLTWWNLNLSSVYVGIWNPSTHVVTPTTPTYPPLGGWRYRLFSRLKVPGIKPRLFGAWAHTWAGLTWVTDASSAYSTMGGWEASLAADPTVTVYPGGQEWLITAQEATKIAAAGGLEFLEEVVP